MTTAVSGRCVLPTAVRRQPAGVCLCRTTTGEWMQGRRRRDEPVGTAFVRPMTAASAALVHADGGSGPVGHATLASATPCGKAPARADAPGRFHTRSGWLTAMRRGAEIEMISRRKSRSPPMRRPVDRRVGAPAEMGRH